MENQENLLFVNISVHVRTVIFCSISNFYTLAQANTEFEAKIKALYIYIKN